MVFSWMGVGFRQLLSLCLLGWYAIWVCHLFSARTLPDKNAYGKMKCEWWSSLFLHQQIVKLNWGLFSQPLGFNRSEFKICPQIIQYVWCRRWSLITLLGHGPNLVTPFWFLEYERSAGALFLILLHKGHCDLCLVPSPGSVPPEGAGCCVVRALKQP